MAEKWTKTSSPDWRWMNPKPLLALNHFTVPCSLTDVLPSFLSYLCFSTASSRKAKEAASVNLQPLQSNLKVLQEQQTQSKHSILCARNLVNSWGEATPLITTNQKLARNMQLKTCDRPQFVRTPMASTKFLEVRLEPGLFAGVIHIEMSYLFPGAAFPTR